MLGALSELVKETGSIQQAARKADVSQTLLSKILRKKVKPGNKCAAYFGYEARTVYLRKDQSQGK